MTYCDPEIASVGLGEEAARELYGDVETLTYDLGGNGKSQILKTAGFVKLVRRLDGPVVGVHIVGARAGELIGEAQLITSWEAYPTTSPVSSTPTPRRTRRSAKRISPWPASRCTRTAEPGSTCSSARQSTLVSARIAEARLSPTGASSRTPEGVPAPMSTSVTLPALGESVTEGTVTRWLKQVGDRVEADEPLLEVSTDKVDTEIPSPAAGVLLEIKAAEDETVEVGAVLAVIGDESEAGGDSSGGSDDGASQAEAPKAGHRPTMLQPPSRKPPRRPTRRRPLRPSPRSSGGSGGSGSGGSGGGSASGTEVTLPALGESVTEGTVTRWLKQVGDSIEADEPLLEVSTDKVDTEIPSPAAGTLLDIKVAEDETVEVGAVLGDRRRRVAVRCRPGGRGSVQRDSHCRQCGHHRGPDGGRRRGRPGADPAPAAEPKPAPAEAKSEPTPAAEESSRATPPAESTPSTAGSDSASGQDFTGYATPLVRKLAAENNVDLVVGQGHRRRRPDPQAGHPGRGRRGQEGRRGRQEGGRGTRSRQQRRRPPAAAERSEARAEQPARHDREDVPAAQDHRQADGRVAPGLGPAHGDRRGRPDRDLQASGPRFKDDFKAREGASLSYLPFITKATIEALKVFPKVNATIDTEAGEISYPSAEHIGIAVDTERGLLVPVIKDAGDLNIAGLAKKIADLAARTRASKVTPDELSRRHLHDHQLRLGGHLDGHPDHQPAAGGHPRHRRAGEATDGDQGCRISAR